MALKSCFFNPESVTTWPCPTLYSSVYGDLIFVNYKTSHVQEDWKGHRYVSKPQAVLLLTVPCGRHKDYSFQEKLKLIIAEKEYT